MSSVCKSLTESLERTHRPFKQLLGSPFFDGTHPGYIKLLPPLALFALRALHKEDVKGATKLLTHLIAYNPNHIRDLNGIFLCARLTRPEIGETKILHSAILNYMLDNSLACHINGTDNALYFSQEIGGRKEQHDDFFVLVFNSGSLLCVLDGIGRSSTSKETLRIIREQLTCIGDLSIEAVFLALERAQKSVAKMKTQYGSRERHGGSTIVLTLCFNSGQTALITIGDSWYITVHNQQIQKSTPHQDSNGALTHAIGSSHTAKMKLDTFLDIYPRQPELIIMATDGMDNAFNLSPKFIMKILLDPQIPLPTKILMIELVNYLYSGAFSDNRTIAAIIPMLADMETEPLIQNR